MSLIQTGLRHHGDKLWPVGVRSRRAAFDACHDFDRFANACNLALGWEDTLASWRDDMCSNGLAPSTINTRLSYAHVLLTKMGIAVNVPWVSRKAKPKWWLTPEAWPDLKLALRARKWASDTLCEDLIDFIEWTMETGLRVEETLRLVHQDFVFRQGHYLSVVVPGTKTERSTARIPLSSNADRIIVERMADMEPGKDIRIFDLSYSSLKAGWNVARDLLGQRDNPTATLKSLRRTFAAVCLQKGIPDRIIQELMRHRNLKTTMEYLHLVGLADTPEVRRMLDRQLGDSVILADRDKCNVAIADFAKSFGLTPMQLAKFIKDNFA